MFENLNKARLTEVAEMFGVDLEGKTSKREMIEEITGMGVTWEMYQQSFPEVEEEEVNETTDPAPVAKVEAPAKPAGTVLMKMVRGNPTFEVRGHRFTKKHPFALVSSDDANYIVENMSGFRIASPREAEEYYS